MQGRPFRALEEGTALLWISSLPYQVSKFVYRPLNDLANWFFRWSGRYVPYTPAENEIIRTDKIFFSGDVPRRLLDTPHWLNQEFKIPRLLREEVHNLLYTPQGRGWIDGKLYERFSINNKGKYFAIRSVLELIPSLSRHGIIQIPQATILQAEFSNTYGDWVAEHLMTMTQCLPLDVLPLLLPSFLTEKSYVRRDLSRLGLEAYPVRQPLLIQKAVVLHKPHPLLSVTIKGVEAYRNAFSVFPPSPQPGSILYLSRCGLKSESVSTFRERHYPSGQVAQILEELGATVVLTKEARHEDYIAVADKAETVVADHGAAMYNILYWNTRNIIELFSDAWWYECFLSLGYSLGVSNHILINIDNFDTDTLRQRLASAIHQCKSSD